MRLAAGAVEIWRIGLDQPGVPIESLYVRLDHEERGRADRFVFPEHRKRYIVAHAALRTMLSTYLGGNPDAVPFVVGPNGKPSLGPGARLRFNLAHSGNLAVAAIALDQEIGVDVEEVGRPVDLAAKT